MDLKKTKIISIILFIFSMLLILTIVASDQIKKSVNVVEIVLINRLNLLTFILCLFFGTVIFICWMTLIIQTSRFEIEFSESKFFMVFSIFSFLPPFSLMIFLRIIYLDSYLREEKINNLVAQMEQNEELKQEISKKYEEFQEKTVNKPSSAKKSKTKNPPPSVITVNQKEEWTGNEVVSIINKKDLDDISNDILSTEIEVDKKITELPLKLEVIKQDDKKSKSKSDDSSESSKMIGTKSTDVIKNKSTDFDRKKYLSLKGTNYSHQKKDGKKKISNGKWEKLISFVDALEQGKMSEEDFNKKKNKLLSN